MRFKDDVVGTILPTESSVRGVCRDPQGTVWFVTEDQVMRYHGGVVDSFSALVSKAGAPRTFLQIGTGSGVQSAYIANLTENAYTIEIIAPLAARTRGLYDKLIEKGYTEFKHIKTKAADGYYGWQEAAPFDKIIVTCGIDHVPPPLLQQLKSGGLMVIPVGPPGAQRVLKVAKIQGADGSITTTREDIYGGKIVPFVPFTKLEGDKIVGTHNR